MSYRSLLIHTVTVRTPGTTGTTSRYNDLIPDEISVEEPARVQPATSREELTDPVSRDTRVTKFLVFLLADTTATGLSTIVWEGRTLKARGEPRVVPGRRGPHHVELDAVEELG